VLARLGLPDRIQVVIWAYESGLVQPGDADAADPARDHPTG